MSNVGYSYMKNKLKICLEINNVVNDVSNADNIMGFNVGWDDRILKDRKEVVVP